jgi:hypothetical protein
MLSRKEAGILVFVTLLFVILIYGSVAKFEVFARPRPPATATNCVVVKPTKAGAVYAERCCDTTTNFNNAGQPIFSSTACQVCQYSGGGSLIDCSTVFNAAPGGLNPPQSAGAEQLPPPPPPPASTLGPPPSTSSNEQPATTPTCPDGSTPDANGNCPNTTIQQLAPPQGSETSNNNLQSEHHHKGTNLLGGESTTPTTKKSKNNNDNTPPAVP